jgi:hypothetical protein
MLPATWSGSRSNRRQGIAASATPGPWLAGTFWYLPAGICSGLQQRQQPVVAAGESGHALGLQHAGHLIEVDPDRGQALQGRLGVLDAVGMVVARVPWSSKAAMVGSGRVVMVSGPIRLST